jgi:ribosomal protein S18 acetylase RimI-like enzyme
MNKLVIEEGSGEYFKMTSERMRQELFGVNATWNCQVAIADNEVVGFCFYCFANTNRAFYTSPLIQIDDLYVKPEYRRKNIGLAFLQKLALIAENNGAGRMEVDCMKENEIGQAFYQKLNGFKKDFIDIYRFYPKDLLEIEGGKGNI